MSLDPSSELRKEKIATDTRNLPTRLTAWLKIPANIGFLMIAFGAVVFASPQMPLFMPLLTDVGMLVGLFFAAWSYRAQIKAGLPMRFPKSSGVIDPNELDISKTPPVPKKAEGIVYLGNHMKTGEEIWLSDTMARTHMMFLGTTGAGKALSNRSLVLTPAGWRRMDDLSIGDVLCLPDGLTTKVKGIFPQGRKQMFHIKLANGRTAECCDEHLWLIKSEGEQRVARTDEMMELLRRRIAFQVPVVDVVPAADGYGSSHQEWTPVSSISRAGYEMATCISVDSAQHLFIVADAHGDRATGIVTHNTEFLLSVVYNALVHGSGFIYVDGKADSSLYGKIYSMARNLGRDCDVRVINFQTGAKDIFGPQAFKMSNTVNPFAVGSSGMLNNLVVSLMSSGKGDVWENRAISFVEALMKPLVFLRDNYGFLLDVAMIRDYFDLKRLEDLAWRDEDQYPGLGATLDGLRSYLDNLPTYDRTKHHQQGETAYEQHGYITMQLVRTFNSLADTYGYIMKTPLAEIDFLDIFLQRRILVVLLPALEKSPAELQNLGKIIVASIKATMAVGLGSRLEGSWAKILDSKPTNSPSPFMCVLDEYGYYSVEGFSVVPAQARSLGFSAIFAGQDLPAFQKSSEKEADSTLANTNTKFAGKLICTKTAKYFTDYSGVGKYAVKSGYETDEDSLIGGVKSSRNTSIEKMDRVTLDDLKSQGTGQWTMWFGDSIVPIKSFFSAPAKVENIRVNRLIKVARPKPKTVEFYRYANQRFISAMGSDDGLASEMHAQLSHDFMIIREGIENHADSDAMSTMLRGLMYHSKEAIMRSEIFVRQMDELGRNNGLPANGSTSSMTSKATEGAGLEQGAQQGAWNADPYQNMGNFAPGSGGTESPWGPKEQPAGQIISGRGPTSIGSNLFDGIDFTQDGDASGVDAELANRLQQPGNVTAIETTSYGTGEDAAGGEWDVSNKFDFNGGESFYPDEATTETFDRAHIYGVSGYEEDSKAIALDQNGRPQLSRRAEPGQGILDRDTTEQGLERLERVLGSTRTEASLNASIAASKLQDVTKYPITKPADSIDQEGFMDAARRLNNRLDVYEEEKV